MREKRTRNPFLFVANQLCLDFVNTQMIVRGEPTDLLKDVSDLVAWLAQAQILTEADAREKRSRWNAAEERRLIGEAHAFRAALRGMAERLAAGKAVLPATIEAINRQLSRRAGYAQIVPVRGRFERRFHSESDDVTGLLTPLAEAASDLLTSGDVSLVKKCRNADCILYFYDTTKNHARQWCSMKLCGNRMKVAAHYRRTRSEDA